MYTPRLVIRGDSNDDAVLCTKDKTFELRAADTSNMLLLTPSLAFSGDTSEINYCKVPNLLSNMLMLFPIS